MNYRGQNDVVAAYIACSGGLLFMWAITVIWNWIFVSVWSVIPNHSFDQGTPSWRNWNISAKWQLCLFREWRRDKMKRSQKHNQPCSGVWWEKHIFREGSSGYNTTGAPHKLHLKFTDCFCVVFTEVIKPLTANSV